MNIGDRAEESPDVDLARQSAPGAYRLESKELTAADDVTAEGQFPEYGWFLDVTGTSGRQYIECPQGLAGWLDRNGVEPGDGFRIITCRKVEGAWAYEVERLSDDDLSRLPE